MSEIVAEGIIQARWLREFANTYTSKPTGVKNPFVSECKIHFDGEGLHVSVMDAAGVAMMAPTHLSKRAFESYEAPGRVTIGVNLVRLLDFTDPADADSLVHVAADMETRRLQLEYGNADLDLAMIDPQSIRQEPEPVGTEVPNWCIITGEQLDYALEVVERVSEHVHVLVDPAGEMIRFDAEGDTDSGGVEYGKSDCFDSKFSEETESLFSLDYLKSLSKPIPSDAEVTIDVGHEHPMGLSWEGIEGHFDVTQKLAPRIDSSR